MSDMELDEKPMLHAPYQCLPSRHQRLVALEYPGPINSIEKAIDSLGGLNQIAAALNSPLLHEDVKKPKIELKLMKGPNGHPVPGFISETGNLVLKVVKRRRKMEEASTAPEVESGIYRYEVLGVAHKTVRFRGELLICFSFFWRSQIH